MAEFNYDCTLRRFNRRVSKYFAETFGSPRVSFEKELRAFRSLSYSSEKENAIVDVNVHSDYNIKNSKYILNSKVEICLNTDVDSPIRKKLEKILRI